MRILKSLAVLCFGLCAAVGYAQQVGGPTNWKNGPAPGNQSNSTLNTQTLTSPYINATAQCLAATSISQPCLAYSHEWTGNGASFTQTLNVYTNNAPADVQLDVCPDMLTSTVATAGSAYVSYSYTPPSGNAIAGQWYQNMNLTTTTGPSNTCAIVTVKAGQSFTIVVGTNGVTGSPVWELEFSITRLY